MTLADGITYNIRGLWLGLKTPKLLFWGLVRFFMVIAITIISATFILSYHQEILNLIWSKPESAWIIWLWHMFSWLLSFILVGVSAVISYLVSQILFSVIIMDHMSRITEIKMTGNVKEPEKMPMIKLFLYLIRQEIPRTIIPVMISLILMMGGLTPIGPILAILSTCIAAVFLAWDNTDLLPARRLFTFKERFGFLKKNILFHLGFGLPFLIPVLNLLFLSFAPVGATIYQLDKNSVDQK
ncbi:MAG: EI24 domain-containing protein [Deltaproteobacteria bacterium]|nr:EI24 domain-containing protein [Deltaproteobacteria bacterium]